MSKFGFLIKRAVHMDYKHMFETAKEIHKKTGKSIPWLMKDMLDCAVRYRAGYMDYKIARMYDLNDDQKKTVITRGISNSIVRAMNDKKDWHFFDDKTEFNTLFKKYIHRDWIRADKNLKIEDLERFLKDKNEILYKPLEGSSGQGIEKYQKNDWHDPAAFLTMILNKGDAILEQLVVQCHQIASLCPTSVNTIRVATLLGDKKQGIVYAFIRIGNGKVMDNVDCGGMAARVDLDSGKILTVAANKKGEVFAKHPMTGTDIVGFQVPFWDDIKNMCLEAMNIVKTVRFVAWDVAVTEEGPIFIEGNSFPSHAVPQFAAHYPDGIGILTEFNKFIDVASLPK